MSANEGFETKEDQIEYLKLMISGQAHKADRGGRVLTAIRSYLTSPDVGDAEHLITQDLDAAEFNAGFNAAWDGLTHDILALLNEDEAALAKAEAMEPPTS